MHDLAHGATAPFAPFDQALLAALGDNHAMLIDTLNHTNAQDADRARTAFEARDYERLHALAHRMMGAAVIGAAPFIATCADLQYACEDALEGVRTASRPTAASCARLTRSWWRRPSWNTRLPMPRPGRLSATPLSRLLK